jgi:hypothetical protein
LSFLIVVLLHCSHIFLVTMDKNDENSGRKSASSPARPSSTEAMAGTPPPGKSQANAASPPAPQAIPPGTGMPNNGNTSAPMDPMAAAMLQRQKEDQQIMEARLLMQQRQADESLLAAAMATASNNMMSSGQYPHLNPHSDALLYQQALMLGRGGMLPVGGAAYGGLVRPNNMPPNMMAGPQPPIASAAPVKRPSDADSAGSKDNGSDPAKKKKKPNYMNSKRRPYVDASVHPDPRSDEEDDEDSDDGSGDNDDDKAPRARQNESFPHKLYRMLDEAKKNGNEDILSFFPHGRAFGIHKPRRFITEIM